VNLAAKPANLNITL